MIAADPAGELGSLTVDKFLGGRVTLVQPGSGHRAGLDAALLQAVVPGDAEGFAVDLGTGVGSVAFSVAARALKLHVTGVERDRATVALARRALLLDDNKAFSGRVRIIEADVTARGETGLGADPPPQSADWVGMNPPFDVRGRVRESPEQGRREAHVADAGSLALWCRAAARLLRAGGALGVIHRSSHLPDLLNGLEGRFGDIRVMPVHPRADRPAVRILVRTRLGSRAALQILPGLVLHHPGGAWTERADALLNGRAELAL